MSNVTVRKENGSKTAALATQEPRWDPFRVARELMNWDPFREMAPFVSQADASFMPSFEIKESKEAFIFKADVPGVKESDLELTVTGNRLTVSGKREAEKEESTDRYYAYERSYGTFTRAFTLPEGVNSDSVHADLKEGVLTISVAKKPEAQPKKIAVQSAAKKS